MTTIVSDMPSFEQHNTRQSNYPIAPQSYVDDISKMLISISAIEKMKDELTVKLSQPGLKINESKTEEYVIKRPNCDNCSRDCKLIDSLLNTQNDNKRRKVLAINAANKLKHRKLRYHHLSESKSKSYITPIFLYNCELWIHCAKNEVFH